MPDPAHPPQGVPATPDPLGCTPFVLVHTRCSVQPPRSGSSDQAWRAGGQRQVTQEPGRAGRIERWR